MKYIIPSKKNSTVSLIGLLAIALLACNKSPAPVTQVANEEVPHQVNADNIKAHVEFLADDTLQGRDTGSHGYQIAANYVKSYFKQLGLTPKGTSIVGQERGFEQQVRFRKSYLIDGSARAIIHGLKGDIELEHATEFLTSGSSLQNDSAITASTVFVGYGVVSPEFGYNDYDNIDVKGKIVVALTGRPDDLPSEEGAHIGASAEKSRHAAEHGAIGFITLHTPKREKVRSFEKSAQYAQTPRLSWLTKDNVPFGTQPEILAGAYLHQTAAKALFTGAVRTLEDIYSADTNNNAIKGFALPYKVTLKNRSRYEEITSPNIIAAVEGSDQQLKNEYVVFSAHLDHIGISSDAGDDDTINNGALDNASGVAILLETARLLAEMPIKPKRSVLFVVVTGEEKGLLGSSYFANNPTIPVMQLVANVNLDMPLILYPFADVIAFGSTHSTMGKIVATAANKINIELSEDPMPEQALFTRSDHYSFVKAGIPSVFLMTGFKSTDESIDGGAVFGDFLKNHYHQHSDEITLPINYQAAASFALVNMMIGLEIANQVERPQWHDGDFFAVTFAQ
ncbi:M28 family peptidase [Colwellia sp. M166]|uniref:M28 family metallopeptidase n=1 Tax=Colwellia sp. M166 TaxID=2583805 RepID=UPI00211E8508|nr:M28 family metallopeptidase [Colwellia sp. M166]UUO24109.1 M28 family peptidase [Colwellia sp. M166]|tara:strand:+ start:33875 stop:35572 length:1698 start_codon:yes stop_codon:yes gene_type:complete